MINQQCKLKITFELTQSQARGVSLCNNGKHMESSGEINTDAAEIIEYSRHTVLVKASEQHSKLLTMQDQGYRVVKILTCAHREITPDGWK